MDGQIVDPADGSGTDGATITIIRTGGVRLARDTATAQSAHGGFWRVELPALETGDVIVDATVRAPGDSVGYSVRNVRVATVDRAGEARLIDRWVRRPYYAVQAELFFRSWETHIRLIYTEVEFHRTGGVELTQDVYRGTSDAFGRVSLFGVGDFPKAFGDVLGD
jgi:hypothetical protein